jgi:hypothetical protein
MRDVEELHHALQRTIRRGSARFEFRYQASLDGLVPECRGVNRVMVAATAFAIRRMGPVTHSGLIEFQAGRCAFALARHRAGMVVGDRFWSGATGTSIDELAAAPAVEHQALWHFDLLRGVVGAEEQVTQRLDGDAVRRFSVRVDLDRAAMAVPYAMAVPGQIEDPQPDLDHVALNVWVGDDGCIRRVRRRDPNPDAPLFTTTLDLTDLGIEVPADWSRIPTWV